MAISSASRPRQYSNYTNPFDLNIFNTVLQTKQAKFDQGASALQSRLDGMASLDVIDPSDKEYLNSKINDTINGINKIGGQDLSDMSVVTQLSGFVSGIGKDQRIQDAVTDTKKIRGLQASYAEIKKNASLGKKGVVYNPANEYADMMAVNKYLTDKRSDPNARYNGSMQATPYRDVLGKMREIAKSVAPSTIVDVIAGASGYEVITKSSERRTPSQIMEAIMSQLDSADQNQIQIDAQFRYKDTSDAQLVNEYTSLAGRELKNIEERLANSEILSKIDPSNKAKETLIKQRDDLRSLIERKRQDMTNFLVSNRESAINQLYTGRLVEGLANNFAYSKEGIKIQPNQGRIHQEQMTLRRELANQSAQLKMGDQQIRLNELKYRIGQDAQDQANIDRKYQLELAKAQTDAMEKGYTFTLDGKGVELIPTGKGAGTYIGNSFSNEANVNTLDNLRNSNTVLEQQKRQVANEFYTDFAKNYDKDHTLFDYDPVSRQYIPNDKFKATQAELFKAVTDMANGRKPAVSGFTPATVDFYKRYQDLEIIQKSNQDLINNIQNQATSQTKASAKAALNITDLDYNNYIRGKEIFQNAPSTPVKMTPGMGVQVNSEVKDLTKLTKGEKKAVDDYNRLRSKIDPIYNKELEKAQSQYSDRINPVGTLFTEAESKRYKTAALAQKSGYYMTDATGGIIEKPENNEMVLTPDNIFLKGKITRNVDGKGYLPYFEAVLDRGKDSGSNTIYIPIDEATQKMFPGTNSSYAISEALKNAPYNTIEFKSFGAVKDSKVTNVFDVQVIQHSDGVYGVAVKQPYDERGRPLGRESVWVNMRQKFPSAEAAKQAADNIASYYSQSYEQTKQLHGKKLSARDFIYQLEK